MKVVLLEILALTLVIQHTSACVPASLIPRYGCKYLGEVLQSDGGVKELNVCGYGNSESCSVDGVGIVDKSVTLESFEYDPSSCSILGIRTVYNNRRFAVYYTQAKVINAEVVLVGQERDANGEINNFQVRAQVSVTTDIYAYSRQLTPRSPTLCVRSLRGTVTPQQVRVDPEFEIIEGVLSEESIQKLSSQLPNEIGKLVSAGISNVSRRLG